MRKLIASLSILSLMVAPSLMGMSGAHAAGAAGWSGEKLLSGIYDSWEPEVAADPSSSYVYVMYNRFDSPQLCPRCPYVPMVVQASPDGGATWGDPVYVCECRHTQTQYDPSILVTSSGDLYATWLSDGNTDFSKSQDHGQSWSKPIPLSPNRWTDHGSIGASADGRNVYVMWAQGDAWETHSHDFGATWSTPVQVTHRNHFFYYPEGISVLSDGSVVLGMSAYRCGKGSVNCAGPINISVLRSTNGGRSYTEDIIDKLFLGVDFSTSSLTTIGNDAARNLVVMYTGALTEGANSEVWVRSSSDEGVSWSSPLELGQGPSVNSGFPSIAGSGTGDFKAIYMDERTGHWNVWYRSSIDGGATWSADVRLSDARTGAPYVFRNGFGNPYGDYQSIDVNASGQAIAAFGEAPTWDGPGGIWVTTQSL
ncbi:MAG: glycoside hydrolase [Actinomycetota bacterium]|nr:glycoside hydrolase [Actinomycetota bacterium]